MLQRLEPTGDDNSYHNAGGLFLRLQYIEAAVPTKKIVKITSMAGVRKELLSVTEIHMRSGIKHIVPQSITEVLEQINVPINVQI